MSCSKNNAIKYLIHKKLIKPNMELYSPIPTSRLSLTIEKLTNLAKTKYGVDMGDLFTIRFRNTSVGNYLTLGSLSVVTRAKVEANTAAFDAIDRSEVQEDMRQQRELEKRRYDQLGQVVVEYEKIQQEGNYIINDDGGIAIPTSLPQINVRC